MTGQRATDDEVLASIASAGDPAWADLFAMPLWSSPASATESDASAFIGHAYDLGLVAPFDWPRWYSPGRFPAGVGLDSAPVADAVRLTTSFVRGNRFNDDAVLAGITDGTIPAAINRLWAWYRQSITDDSTFVDHAEYSDDGTYRWTYERRWAPGASLCWVGLNPGTGDTDNGRRPTLARVVSWAKRERCAAVVVVNLYSFRSTDPAALRSAEVDIIGHRTDEAISHASQRARVTLAAWGGNKAIGTRSRRVMELLHDPVCAGTTKSGEPRHPLYVAEATPLMPYRPTADTEAAPPPREPQTRPSGST